MAMTNHQMKLIIRADASTQIGTGHVMRCLALAQAWQMIGKEVVFILKIETAFLETRLKAEGFKILYLPTYLTSFEDAHVTAKLSQELNSQWIIVDGYQFDGRYQQIIKDYGLKLLFIDDYGHAEHYYADFILNQNISADESLYTNRESYTQLLLGTRYTLLRQEFWQWQGWQRINPPIASKLLVTMGGADPDNVTLKVIQGLELVRVDGLEVIVVVGGSNPHYEKLQLLAKESKLTIHIEKNVKNMPELIAWADVAITAGGSTCWELAFMGLPSVILIVAENQIAIAQKLNDLGVFINLGHHQDINFIEIASAIDNLITSATIRAEMTEYSQKLVDAKGSKRVLNFIEKDLLKLRLACLEDSRLLWEWVNDSDVRIASFSSDPIPWEDHIQWFNKKLISNNCIFYIGTDHKNLPIGQVRYDIENNEAIVSVIIDRKFRHQGYGTRLLKLAQTQVFKDKNISKIHAYIKPYNQFSIQAFTQVGFQNMGITTQQGQAAVHLVLNR